MKQPDPYTVESPWGGIAGFFMIQCFGFVTLQGFRVFLNVALHGSDPLSELSADGIAGRVLVTVWGGIWILGFVAFQADIFRRLFAFARRLGMPGFLRALRAPSETVKMIIAACFGAVYVFFLLGHYPFPSRPVTTHVGILFSVFGWIVSAVGAWGIRKGYDKKEPYEALGTAGSVMGYLIGTAMVVSTLRLFPGLFYLHGMLGLGAITMVTCQLLFKAPCRLAGEHLAACDD